ncbi:hypothetical protein HGRIS_012339 [Hohenbuehelia grisea]|uniref:Uncharacterized protein n=1 Tax=Hohenbuehelia grisea TaxID=104357 RepID=A0ABR3IRY0_9AGAR
MDGIREGKSDLLVDQLSFDSIQETLAFFQQPNKLRSSKQDVSQAVRDIDCIKAFMLLPDGTRVLPKFATIIGELEKQRNCTAATLRIQTCCLLLTNMQVWEWLDRCIEDALASWPQVAGTFTGRLAIRVRDALCTHLPNDTIINASEIFPHVDPGLTFSFQRKNNRLTEVSVEEVAQKTSRVLINWLSFPALEVWRGRAYLM